MQTALEALKSLEDQIAEVKYSASIAATLIGRLPPYEQLPDGRIAITLHLVQLENLDFAVHEVQRRALDLHDFYQGLEIAEEAQPSPRAQQQARPATDTVEARDRLDDGISLLKTAWLAMCGRSAEFEDFGGREAVTDTMCRALNKLDVAKKRLEQ